MAFLAPPGVPGCLRDLEKNCKNSQKIYKKLTCIKKPQIIALRPILGYLDYPGGPQGGQKVIWWCKKFFLAESIWSFRQNTLYIPGIRFGGWWTLILTLPIYHPPLPWWDFVMVGICWDHHQVTLLLLSLILVTNQHLSSSSPLNMFIGMSNPFSNHYQEI